MNNVFEPMAWNSYLDYLGTYRPNEFVTSPKVKDHESSYFYYSFDSDSLESQLSISNNDPGNTVVSMIAGEIATKALQTGVYLSSYYMAYQNKYKKVKWVGRFGMKTVPVLGFASTVYDLYSLGKYVHSQYA